MEVKLNNIDEKAQSIASSEVKSSHEENVQIFDLKSELSKISCLHHYESLVSRGYSDKGAFFHLDDGVLAGKGLWIQKKERIKILAVGASLREHFDQHNEATGMSRHRFFRHNLNPATNERFACGGEENAGKCDSSIPKAIHPPSLQRKIDNIRRKTEVDASGFLKCHSPQVVEGTYCCQKHKNTSHVRHMKYIELRRHHAETNLKSVIARADSDLYKNGFLPRTVLRKIAVDYLLMEGSSNRYYPCSSHSAPSAAILANMRNRKQPSSSLVVRTESKFRLSSYDEKLPEFRDHILRAAVIESGKIEILLDSCILDSERFHQTLYWAGEIERTKLPHTNPSLRMEFWDHTRPGEITVKMTDNPGTETTNSLSFSPEVAPQLPHRADTIFYCLDTFSRLLLIMIEKRASRYCHQNDLFVA